MTQTVALIKKYFHFESQEWKPFIIYGLTYSVLILIIPLAVQLVVNQIALSGLKLSLITIVVIISAALFLAQLVRYAQIILLEYLQRKFKYWTLPIWNEAKNLDDKYKYYYFELASVQKKMGSWCFDGFELTLSLLVGLVTLGFYHPFFLLMSLLTIASLYIIYKLGNNAIQTSYDESTSKYEIFYKISGNLDTTEKLDDYFSHREAHFKVIKRQTKFIMWSQFVGQILLLFGGALLVDINQLSIGQFVAAELIYSTIFYSFTKAPKFLENHYDLVTSLKKIDSIKRKETYE